MTDPSARVAWSRASAILVPTALALVLRVRGVFDGSIWSDELHVVAAAKQGVARAIQVAAADVYPPLYYVLAALFDPADPHRLRLISAIAGTLTVLLVAGLGLRLGTPRSAWLGGLWLAVLPAHVHWSQEARAYALIGLLIVALGGNVLVGGATVVTALLTSALMYTHGLAPVYLLPIAVLLVWTRDWGQLMAIGIGALTFLPWLTLGFSQGERYQGFGGEALTWVDFLSRSLAYLGSGHIDASWALWSGAPMLLLLAMLAARKGPAQKLLVGVALGFVALAAAAPFIGGLMGKHALPLAGLVALAFGLGAQNLPSRAWWLLVPVVLAAPTLGLVRGAARDPVRFDVRAVVAAASNARPAGPLASNRPELVRLYQPAPVLGVPLDDPAAMLDVYQWQQHAFARRARAAWWIVEGAQPELLGKLRAVFPVVWVSQQRGALGVAVALESGVPLPVREASLERVLLEHEGDTLAFYQAGSARMLSEASGALTLWMTASAPESNLAVRITSGAAPPIEWHCGASPLLERRVAGHVEAGSTVELVFADEAGAGGMDANVWVYRVEVTDAAQVPDGCSVTSR
ncbi:MAG: hypothetical protein V4850_01100 [Myxococcota bacterium]